MSSIALEGVEDYGDGKHYRQGELVLGTYVTGGVAVSAAQLGFSTEPRAGIVDIDVSPAGGYVFEWVRSTGKVKAYWVDTTVDGAPLAEVPNATDMSAISARFRARGS